MFMRCWAADLGEAVYESLVDPIKPEDVEDTDDTDDNADDPPSPADSRSDEETAGVY